MRRFNTRAGLAALVFTGMALSAPVQAQGQFPSKPVHIVMPFGPGGVADVTVRLVAQKLTERTGQNFIIENRPGGGTVLAAKAAMSAPADGYTMLLTGNSAAINYTLLKAPPFNVLTDFTPVAMLTGFEMLLVTKADAKLDTIPKLIEYAKQNPGKLNLGAINVGSTQNLSVHLFKLVTGVDVQVVPYRTTPDLTNAIMRGDVDVGFDYLAAFKAMIENKQVKVLATSGEEPNPELPGVPLMKDIGYPEYVVTSWNGVSVLSATPKPVIEKLNSEIQAVMKMPEIQEKMRTLGISPMLGSPDDMGKRMRADIEKWRVVIEKSGIEKQ